MISKHPRKTAAAMLAVASLTLFGGQPPTPFDVSNHHHLSTFGNAGNGRLHQAVQALGNQRRAVLVLDTNDTLRANLKIPKNISLVHLGAADINLGGNILMMAGPFTAAPTRVFTGNGEVQFAPGSVSQVVPQWWGDNNADSVQTALNTAGQCGAELFLPAGDYVFDSPVRWNFTDINFEARSLIVRGAGPGRTVVHNRTTSQSTFTFSTQTAVTHQGWFLHIEGLELTSAGTGSSGIMVEDVWNGRITDCLIRGHALDGILMSADVNDFGLPKTWMIDNSLIVDNGRYGINLAAPGNATVAFNVKIDHLDIEKNAMGGIYAAAEMMQVTNTIVANNGTGPNSHGGIYVTGIPGYWVYENTIADSGFEANVPFDIYANRLSNLVLARNDHSRVAQSNGLSQDQFVRLTGLQGAFNVILEHNQFSSGLTGPFTAVLGGAGLRNIDLENNIFNLTTGNTNFSFTSGTKVTRRTFGDTVLTNQEIQFTDGAGTSDVRLRRAGPGMLTVEGIATTLQSVPSQNGSISVDCKFGLTILHSLTQNTTLQAPLNPSPGAILNLSVFQPPASSHTISFDPVFKVADTFTASPLHFSTIRFFYTGLYWVQLGAAAIDAPL